MELLSRQRATCKNNNKKNKNIFISINNDIANLYLKENYTNSTHSNNDDFNKSNDYKI